jgi:hypothetical protein
MLLSPLGGYPEMTMMEELQKKRTREEMLEFHCGIRLSEVA